MAARSFPEGTKSTSRSSDIVSLLLEKLPLLVLSAASSLITFKAQHAAGAVAPIDALPLSHRLANAAVAYAAYLGKTIWPINLAVSYPLFDQVAVTRTVVGVLVLASITIGVILSSSKRPWLPTGWLWFLGTLVPVIGLVQVGDQAMADRYTYVPLIGLFIMIVWTLPRLPSHKIDRHPAPMVIFGAGLVMIALGTLTFLQVQVWRDTITLFTHAIKVTNNNFTAHNLLGGALTEQGDLVGARRQMRNRCRSNQITEAPITI